jgi:hypothetical protein
VYGTQSNKQLHWSLQTKDSNNSWDFYGYNQTAAPTYCAYRVTETNSTEIRTFNDRSQC